MIAYSHDIEQLGGGSAPSHSFQLAASQPAKHAVKQPRGTPRHPNSKTKIYN